MRIGPPCIRPANCESASGAPSLVSKSDPSNHDRPSAVGFAEQRQWTRRSGHRKLRSATLDGLGRVLAKTRADRRGGEHIDQKSVGFYAPDRGDLLRRRRSYPEYDVLRNTLGNQPRYANGE